MKIHIVTPVYNDWPSFHLLLEDLQATAEKLGYEFYITAVDDGSALPAQPDASWLAPFPRIAGLEVVCLACNLGHQRAIVIGLVLATEKDWADYIVVMDSDGEDQPADIARLLEHRQGGVVVARRKKRSEGFQFRVGYSAYKFMFRLLTGNKIDFGNFCLLRKDRAQQITYSAHAWNHLAGTLMRSRFPMHRIDVVRGRRYADSSSMNLVSLMSHGLSAMAVYVDVCLVRLMIVLGMVVFLTLTSMFGVAGIRFLTDLAIPGWASMVFGTLSVILMQSVLFTLLAAFTVLHSRGQVQVIPALDAKRYVAHRFRVDNQREQSLWMTNSLFMRDVS